MEVKNLYNFSDLKALSEQKDLKQFGDSGIILERNLTAINPKIYQTIYPELSFVNSGISIDNTGGYARRIQSLKLSEQGSFVNSSDLGTGKGAISLSAEDSFLSVVARAGFSAWTHDDVEEAKLAKVNLVQNYLKTHTKLYTQEVDEIGLVGKSDAGIEKGILNYAGFKTSVAGDKVENLTPQQAYDAIAGLVVDQHTSVNNVSEYSADTVLMPIRVLNKLKTVMLNTASGSSTVYKALTDNFPSIKFITSFRCESVGGNSVTIAYSTNADGMVFRIPQPFSTGKVIQQSSYTFQVESKFRIAGIDVLENDVARTLTGL